MEWRGENIKTAATARRVSLTGLAEQVGVSRQTVNDWIRGQIPKGHHLLSVCQVLQQEPDYFFIDNAPDVILTPAHRKRGNAKVKAEMQDEAFELAREYELLFRQAPKSELMVVTREQSRSNANAQSMARQMRSLAGVQPGEPIDYDHTFQMLEQLGINVVFRDFPKAIKSYAFYTVIHGHRIVFVNNATNVIDLIFPLLHETVHAVRDEVAPPDRGYDQAEEDFCDLVAGYIQFPAEYVNRVYSAIAKCKAGSQVNNLKKFGRKFSHSLFGIVKQIQRSQPDFDLNVAGADANLRKQFPTIGQILCKGDQVQHYVKMLALLSPNFTRLVEEQVAGLSDRKLCELLGLDGVLDRNIIREELEKITVPSL